MFYTASVLYEVRELKMSYNPKDYRAVLRVASLVFLLSGIRGVWRLGLRVSGSGVGLRVEWVMIERFRFV